MLRKTLLDYNQIRILPGTYFTYLLLHPGRLSASPGNVRHAIGQQAASACVSCGYSAGFKFCDEGAACAFVLQLVSQCRAESRAVIKQSTTRRTEIKLT